VLFFDGDCAMCNRGVGFIANRIPDDVELMFASLNSAAGQHLLTMFPLARSRDALVLLHKGEIVQGALAVATVLELLPRWAILGRWLRLVPERARESAYDLVARSRHGLARPSVSCRMPGPRVQARLSSQALGCESAHLGIA